MATPHNNAPDGAFAKTVLMPGDPLRAKFIAETFLEDVKLVTSVRNCLGFTGKYKGVPVSVMASGMGMPSIGIYSHELYSFYGVENIIRVGSAGSYTDRLAVQDVVLADSCYSESSYALVHNGVTDKVLYPSEEVNRVIWQTAEELGITLQTGEVHSSDVFYSGPNAETWQSIRERTSVDCVEMESFALFHNANVLGKRAACLLTISDSFISHVELTAEERQNSFRTMMTLALESAIRL
ncbi:MAG: purine-nucleoside phosphorylase [Muribaculaceae bacterium]|nr:purine-nucleoside phosphorylase [Muribaculaceae bacterium]MBR1726483.1 purine-nucleoside phosphorylase [Muribaculaceae bacterium]